jgi:hypothetical protein
MSGRNACHSPIRPLPAKNARNKYQSSHPSLMEPHMRIAKIFRKAVLALALALAPLSGYLPS